MSDLKGKTIFITGGARRLGHAIALSMARAGAKIAFTYLQSEREVDSGKLMPVRVTGYDDQKLTAAMI